MLAIAAAAVIGAACVPATNAPTTAATGTPIKIGFVWGVTGAIAEIVRPASEAAHAYFDDLNRRGGIHGHPVQMVEIDSKYQVPLAQEGYKKVTTEDNVPLVVLASTGDTEALAAQINADHVPTLTFSCDEKWAKPELNPYLFTICTTYQDQISTALKFIKRRELTSGGAPRVAFSYPDIPFGQSPIAVGKEYAQTLGLPLVGEAKVGAADVEAQSQALALKSGDPNYVIVQNVAGGASAMVRSAKQVGLRSQFVGLNYAFDEATINAIGAEAAEGYIGVGPSAFPGPEVGVVQEMVTRAPALKELNMRAIVGWTLASVIADALERAPSASSSDVLKSLEQTDLDVEGAIPGSFWVYSPTSHVPTRKSVFYQVVNGRIEKISDPIDPPDR
ncbi:MAG: ABC transporter substrate-binding protein [Chloroflexi bacterium]|nr:ABC transporter substrate-binding protein [Chloroflexota bacterium]